MAITVKQLMADLRHCDPDKEVVAVKLIKGGCAGWSELELTEGGQDADSVEEFDGRVFIWVGA